jgi:hypothetical protein
MTSRHRLVFGLGLLVATLSFRPTHSQQCLWANKPMAPMPIPPLVCPLSGHSNCGTRIAINCIIYADRSSNAASYLNNPVLTLLENASGQSPWMGEYRLDYDLYNHTVNDVATGPDSYGSIYIDLLDDSKKWLRRLTVIDQLGR